MTSTSLHEKYSNYRFCIVRECKHTSIKTPGKLWIRVPSEINIRNKWLRLAQRDPESISTVTQIYFCEDHFDLENDMENYMQYKIMGSVKRIRMKPGYKPSRFASQSVHKRQHSPNSDPLEHPHKNGLVIPFSADSKSVGIMEISTASYYQGSNEEAPSNNGPSHAPGNFLDSFHDFVSQKRFDAPYRRQRKKATDAAKQSKNKPIERDERLQVQTIKQEEIEKDNCLEDYQIEGNQDVDPLLGDQQVDQQPVREENSLCSFCYMEIDRFLYACVQCACQLCGVCDARGEHQYHYVLRIPAHRLKDQEDVQKIMAQVREAVEGYKLDSDTESEAETKPEVSGLVNLPPVEVEFPTTELESLPTQVEFPPVEMEFPPAEVEFSPAEVNDPPVGIEFLPVKEEPDDYFECTETGVTMVKQTNADSTVDGKEAIQSLNDSPTKITARAAEHDHNYVGSTMYLDTENRLQNRNKRKSIVSDIRKPTNQHSNEIKLELKKHSRRKKY